MLGIKIDRSIIDGDSSKLFRAAIRSRQTLDSYERKLAGFLKWIGLDCDAFVNLAKVNQKDAETKIGAPYSFEQKAFGLAIPSFARPITLAGRP